jgi:hypothetical protein
MPAEFSHLFFWKCKGCHSRTGHSGNCAYNPKKKPLSNHSPFFRDSQQLLSFNAGDPPPSGLAPMRDVSANSSSSASAAAASASATAADARLGPPGETPSEHYMRHGGADDPLSHLRLHPQAPEADADDDPFNSEETDEPEVQETVVEVSVKDMEKLNAYTDELKSELPKMKGLTPRDEEKNWRQKAPRHHQSDTIPFPSAFLSIIPVQLFIVLRFALLIFFDIGMFYPHLFPKELKCPICGKCGNIRRKGFLSGYTVVSGLDPGSNWLLKPVTYEHT